MKICIDAGHGGTDPGAENKLWGVNYAEKDVALTLAKMLRDTLITRFDVVMTRDSDVFLTLDKRAEIANQENADLFISIHINAHEKSEAQGFESFIFEKAPNDSPVRDYQKVIHEEVAKLFTENKRADRGAKAAKFRVLSKTKCPAILLELGFISNFDDLRLIAIDEIFQTKVVAAIHRGLIACKRGAEGA
jgi:N-acetylmuramoyl-L-alanine amidase